MSRNRWRVRGWAGGSCGVWMVDCGCCVPGGRVVGGGL